MKEVDLNRQTNTLALQIFPTLHSVKQTLVPFMANLSKCKFIKKFADFYWWWKQILPNDMLATETT